MKKIINILALVAIILFSFSIVSCKKVLPTEITELNLSNCLTPGDLKMELENDVEVLCKWISSKDAESYHLILATDKNFTNISIDTYVPPKNVPVKFSLEHATTYYFKVQATSSKRGPSHWAICPGSITTL